MTCINQWWTHGHFSQPKQSAVQCNKALKGVFSPCKAQTYGSRPSALIVSSLPALNKSIKLQIPSLLQKSGKLLPHVLFPYPAAVLEFRLCTLSNFSHCENNGIKQLGARGESRDEGDDSKAWRSWVCGARVWWGLGMWWLCVCVRGDSKDRAWIWPSIHTGSRVIVGLHPVSGGSSGLTASGLNTSDTTIPQVSSPATMSLTSHRGPENMQTQERGVLLQCPPSFTLYSLRGIHRFLHVLFFFYSCNNTENQI